MPQMMRIEDNEEPNLMKPDDVFYQEEDVRSRYSSR